MDILTFDPSPPRIRILDQRFLPDETYRHLLSSEEVACAIETLMVRGAPLVGITAAYGVALAWLKGEDVSHALKRMAQTRPTAVNLFWALERMENAWKKGKDLLQEAKAIHQEEIDRTRAIAHVGAERFSTPTRVLTLCNTGILATGGIGTALGVIYELHRRNLLKHTWVLETRPVLQGARLTVYELSRNHVPFSLVVDSQAASLMAQGEVDAVIVGADRVAANGDTANKIGTLMLAVLAHYYKIPFYVATPTSTLDPTLPDGAHIPIETRSPEEVRTVRGCWITLPDAPVRNEAFDITPFHLITGWITEKGVWDHPTLQRWMKSQPSTTQGGGG